MSNLSPQSSSLGTPGLSHSLELEQMGRVELLFFPVAKALKLHAQHNYLN